MVNEYAELKKLMKQLGRLWTLGLDREGNWLAESWHHESTGWSTHAKYSGRTPLSALRRAIQAVKKRRNK